ncbi:MAG: hypothetical protein PHW21_03185 [Candidatus Izemoplasmatales bacterium]|nr:hypothetical protein [Candidatus Izemoplasmatales bacterium]
MANKRINLSGTWTLDFKGRKIEANVPGSVYQDLLKEKIIPDPFDQDNEYLVREYMNEDYSYERSFEINAFDLSDKEVYIVFEGLDTLTMVYLNESLILETDNMHRIYKKCVNEFLRDGNNLLRVEIKSCLKYIKNEEENYPHKLYQAGDSVRGYIHLRKASYMFGWDWGPQLPDGGISRDVYLDITDKATLEDVFVRQIHQNDDVDLKVLTTVKGNNLENLKIVINIYEDNEEKPISSITGDINQELLLSLINPKKWYPINYGNQDRYLIEVKLFRSNLLLETKKIKIGLRTVVLEQLKDQYGESFTFNINGIRVFAKGSNYIPEDNLLGRTNEELTRKLLGYAKDANHNMIRVWGGGIYPPNYFYDICDELGLMVWQDLMFACSIYPMDKEYFVENIKEEIKDNLIRIRNHPSIVLICGNNENETAIENWNIPSLDISKDFYKKHYLEIIPKLTNEFVPDLPYWRSSPASKELFEDTNSDNFGDMHYWGVWHNNEPFTNYRLYYPRFMSEFGLQSFPGIKTIETFTKPEDRNIFSYIMEQHQKNKTANSKILDYIGKLFRYPKDFESLLYVSQAIQAEGIRYGVEHWRRNYGRCMGILYWQLNDCWPVASWSSIDYYHRWKILHYHAKKFYSLILVSIEEEKNRAKIFITNDSLETFSGELVIEIMDFSGEIIERESLEVNVDFQSAKLIVEKQVSDKRYILENLVVNVTLYKNKEFISDNQVFFLPDKHLKLKKNVINKNLEFDGESYILKLNSQTLAKFVEISVKDEDIIFSDNYFHLIPGKTKTIYFKSNKDLIKNQDLINIKSLVDTY